MKRSGLKRKTPLKAKTPLKSRVGLKRGKGLNKVSEKKKEEILNEEQIRRELCREADGEFGWNEKKGVRIYHCHNGICRKCGKRRNLDLEHKKKRSLMGKTDKKNCRMYCRLCHTKKDGGMRVVENGSK